MIGNCIGFIVIKLTLFVVSITLICIFMKYNTLITNILASIIFHFCLSLKNIDNIIYKSLVSRYYILKPIAID